MASLEEYSEVDFEYLANGGWGIAVSALWNTTWDVAEPSDNVHNASEESFAGWQTLVFTVSDGDVSYYVNDSLKFTHTGDYYPESEMNISFNLWFIADGFAESRETRAYQQDVDWVFHAGNTMLTAAEVEAVVDRFRGDGIARLDTMP
jgi:hypothetical protein